MQTYKPNIPVFCTSEHKREGKVPESFPGILQLSTNLKGTPLLNKAYRDFGEDGNPEFEYFVRYLLPEICPKRTQYKKNGCGKKTMSQAFTPTDEAFGLMILDNELHVWNYQVMIKKRKQSIDPTDARNKKKYTDMYQKKSCGWKDIGLCYYTLLVKEVNEVQKNKQACECEDHYFNKFPHELGLDPKTSSVTGEDNEEARAIR